MLHASRVVLLQTGLARDAPVQSRFPVIGLQTVVQGHRQREVHFVGQKWCNFNGQGAMTPFGFQRVANRE